MLTWGSAVRETGGKRLGEKAAMNNSQRGPASVWRFAWLHTAASPTLRTAITPQPQTKCCFNSGRPGNPVINPFKGQAATLQVQIVCRDSISQRVSRSRPNRNTGQALGKPCLARPSPSRLRSGGSRLQEATFNRL